MKRKLVMLLFGLLLSGDLSHAAPLGTAFTYQGRLDQNGQAAPNGNYIMRFGLYDAPAPGGNLVNGASLLTVPVTNGLFTTDLNFGSNVFEGEARWLEISVSTNNAVTFTILLPRTRLAPTPNAIYAATSGNVATGQVVKSLNGLRDDVTLVAGSGISLSPSGNGLTLAATVPVTSPWAVNGTSAYYNGGNVGIGTAAPSFPFHINSSATGSSVLAALLQPNLGNGGIDQIYLGRTGSGNACGTFTYTYYAPDPALSILSLGLYNSSYTLNVRGNGRVGIGVTDPVVKLDVRSTDSTAIYGKSTAVSGAGGFFESAEFEGVRGEGNNIDHGAIVGVHNAGGWGIYGLSSGNGVVGESTAGGFGVFGRSAEFEGVRGEGNNINHGAIVGVHNAGGWGMYGLSSGNGVVGESTAGGVGVFGRSSTWEGVHGETSSPNAAAVAGIGLSSGAGVYGESRGGGYGGYFIGRVRVGILEIAGGADLAEPFQMKEETIAKGSVVVIDREHPGQLKRSTQAYDKRVAGIVSGANGINPGIALKQENALDRGENVALTGRVYVQADATYGAIESGDLLTTSDTPGHAMKASDPARAQGAILGKAMSALKESTGLVLVLVTLQ